MKNKDTRLSCRHCGSKTWGTDYAAFMRDHDTPDGVRCMRAKNEITVAEREFALSDNKPIYAARIIDSFDNAVSTAIEADSVEEAIFFADQKWPADSYSERISVKSSLDCAGIYQGLWNGKEAAKRDRNGRWTIASDGKFSPMIPESDEKTLKPVIWHERPSEDPMTGEEGILRHEYALEKMTNLYDQKYLDAWGLHYLRYRPDASVAIWHRYIRRGNVEPWKLFQAANSFEQALASLEGNYESDNSPAGRYYKELQQRRAGAAEKQKREEEEKKEREYKAETRYQSRKRSDAAFVKMLEGKQSALAVKWNAFAAKYADQVSQTKDETLIKLAGAVIEAETIPTKAKAMKAFFTYVENQLGLYVD